jgi:DNA gyrase subunit B/topoisomerase-4 subunit B
MNRPPAQPAAPRPFTALPPKLQDCTLHGPESGAELFIVEGDSASAAVAAVRDPHRQAVLALQGKPLNAARARPARVAADPFLGALAGALGIPPSPGPARDAAHDPARGAVPASLRYERVLLLHDPDADGIHIGALLLMYFDRWMPALLDAGRIERVHAPLGEVHGAPGTPPVQAFGDAHFHALCERARALRGTAFVARRYRGLGGLGAAALRATCIDPATRMTSVLHADDARHATRVFGARHATPLGQSA